MATVITVAQQKGGAGKTTLVAQLAVTWARSKTVALIDIDPQKSLSAWYKVRQEALGAEAGGLVLSSISGWRLGIELDRLQRRFDFIIIDSPPHAETEARTAIRSGDVVVVPLQPSPMDLWATQATLDLAQKEKRKVLLVVNRLPPRGKLPDVVIAAIRETGVLVAETMLGNRTAFASSLMAGKGVVETEANGTAAQEISALAEEVAVLATC
ncbi:MAG: chromosome partitioning protein [Rhodospirillaceae bacterium]|nr:MAG: chromosome partitioning protein [Rhodospirillaceae bacterium]